MLGVRLQEEVEGVVHRHLGHQVHRDAEFLSALGKNQTGQMIGKRVLLPVDEMHHRLDLQRIRQDAGAAMRGWPQTHDLRRQADQPVVRVMRDVIEGNVNGHSDLQSNLMVSSLQMCSKLRARSVHVNLAPGIRHTLAFPG